MGNGFCLKEEAVAKEGDGEIVVCNDREVFLFGHVVSCLGAPRLRVVAALVVVDVASEVDGGAETWTIDGSSFRDVDDSSMGL